MNKGQVLAALDIYVEESGDDRDYVAEVLVEFLRLLVVQDLPPGDTLVVNTLIEVFDEMIEDFG